MRSLRLPALLAAMSVATIAGSLLSQWYVLTQLGASAQTDALFAAMSLPLLLFDLLSGALGYVLVPLFAASHPEQARKRAWSLAQLLGLLVLGVAGLFAVSASYWMPVLVPGFGHEGRALAVSLTRILLAYPCLAASAAVGSVFLQSQKRFVRAEWNALVAMGASFVYLLWAFPKRGLQAAAWMVVVRAAMELALNISCMGRYCGIRGNGPFLKELMKRARPVVAGGAIFRTDQLVDRLFSSLAPPGHLSLLNLSRQILHAVARVLARALVVPASPDLARAYTEQANERLQELVKSRTHQLLLSCGALSVGLVVIGYPALFFVFQRHNPGRVDVGLLYQLSVILCGLMTGDVMIQLLSAAFYARGDTATPARVGVGCYLVGIGFKAGGFWVGGVRGLAAGLSIYYLFYPIALLLVHRKWCRQVRAKCR